MKWATTQILFWLVTAFMVFYFSAEAYKHLDVVSRIDAALSLSRQDKEEDNNASSALYDKCSLCVDSPEHKALDAIPNSADSVILFCNQDDGRCAVRCNGKTLDAQCARSANSA